MIFSSHHDFSCRKNSRKHKNPQQTATLPEGRPIKSAKVRQKSIIMVSSELILSRFKHNFPHEIESVASGLTFLQLLVKPAEDIHEVLTGFLWQDLPCETSLIFTAGKEECREFITDLQTHKDVLLFMLKGV